MKVVAFNGSPRANGNTQYALEIIKGELEKEGIGTEIIQVGDKPLRGCCHCDACAKTGSGQCVFDDCDGFVNKCVQMINEADGVLMGCPVYYSGIAGNMKCFLDRVFYVRPNLRMKPAAAVVAARRSGISDTFHQVNNFFNLAEAIIVPSQYWGSIHGHKRGEAEQDGEGRDLMRILGQNMAYLLKLLDYGKGAVPVPERIARTMTNFVH